MSDKIIDFQPQINELETDIQDAAYEAICFNSEQQLLHNNINEISDRIQRISEGMGIHSHSLLSDISKGNYERELPFEFFEQETDKICNKYIHINGTKLNCTEILVSCIAGLVAGLLDVLLVGTPDIVKLYRGGEQFDGSVLTSALRRVGSDKDEKFSHVLEWFSDKCKVPYDISAFKDTVTLNNHRLRSFSHDPLFGLLFAVSDIILGTTTCVNNAGKITLLVNKTKSSSPDKYLAVLYYFGHLISDVCTPRGLPIPGFFMLEFFQTGIGDKTIAKIAEDMYCNGYDFRHMLSMSTSVLLKDMLITSYIRLTNHEKFALKSIAETEIENIYKQEKKAKMLLLSDAIATSCNLVKIVCPPSCGNPTAINLVQWLSLIKNGIAEIKIAARDKSVEYAVMNRKLINENWSKLQMD